MNLNLKGKTALVTGASYGLGYFCAEALAQEQVNVAICSRDAFRISEAASKLSKGTGSKVIGIEADLTKEEDLLNLVDQVNRNLGEIDILVLSTGHPPTYPSSQATDLHWEKGIDLILKPAIKLTRSLLPGMRSRNYGRLIYIGSIFGLEPEPLSIVQSTLRTGLNSFAKCIATEAAADGVTANVICPGYFDTPLVQDLAKKYAEEGSVSIESVLLEWKNFAPSKKFGKPEDLGAFVSFLASPKGEFINGTAITIDGGAIKQY